MPCTHRQQETTGFRKKDFLSVLHDIPLWSPFKCLILMFLYICIIISLTYIDYMLFTSFAIYQSNTYLQFAYSLPVDVT